ncbi:MAG: acyl--CoA ligase [Acidimicrobiales bacterium]|nr:acyl--CoA ligase [Acidimicrobiales bacterium]
MAEAEAALLAPGSPFEVGIEEVRGRRMAVFTTRAPHLRAVLEQSARFGDAELFAFDDGRRYTFAQHLDLVASAAAALRDRYGVGPGDRVAILGANSPEWIIAFWATVSLGAIAVGMNGWWQGDEITYGLELTEPSVLVADQKRLARLDGAAPDVPTVVIEDGFGELTGHAPGSSLPDAPIGEDDPAVILFTSGTTGRPKGAVNTHRNIIAFLGVSFFSGARGALVAPPAAPPPPPCALVSSPLFHVSGLHSAAVAMVASGSRSVWTTGRFDAEKVLRLTEQEGITRWGGVTTHIWRILEHPDFDRYDHSSVQSVGGGGSTWSPELQRVIREKLPAASTQMSVGYGLTECAALATMATEDMLRADPTCAGRALPTVELAILDTAGSALPDGEIGEIAIRGPMVMPGYWNNPEATAAAITADGWLRTGDYGHLDDGMLHLASRLRDMIIRGGENIYPIEIENRLDEHPDIAEAAVVGVEHRELGQEVKAVVVPRAGATLSSAAVQQWVTDALAYYKVPAHVEFRSEPLPRNATGKVLKHVLTGEADNSFVDDE